MPCQKEPWDLDVTYFYLRDVINEWSIIIHPAFLYQVGIALKPNTGVDVVTEYVDEADMVLIMTVEPGMSAKQS